MFSSFNKNTPKKIAARENKASMAEAAATLSALQKLLTELPSSQGERLSKDSTNRFEKTERMHPRVEQLIDPAVAALNDLTIRAKDYFHNVEEIEVLEVTLKKAQDQNYQELAKVDELVVSAKFTNCTFRSRLDEIRNELTIAKKDLKTTELEYEASDSVDFWRFFQGEINNFIFDQLPRYTSIPSNQSGIEFQYHLQYRIV